MHCQFLGRTRIRSTLLYYLMLLFLSPHVAFAAPDYTLFIESGYLTINGAGGDVVDVWGYTDTDGVSPMIPGPLLASAQGGTVSVEVVNNHDREHNFVIEGVSSDATAIPPGGRRLYTVDTPDAGVFLYRDTLNVVNQSMGMYGALIVHAPTAGQAWGGGPAFDVERLWVISDMDKPNWNDVAASGAPVNTESYRPNYFLMNGMGGFDGMHDPGSILEAEVDQVGLIRIVNAGQFDESLHFHGNHLQVISRNGVRESQPRLQATINVKASSTMMVLYRFDQPGIFPMHVHTAQMETANGVYLNGTATLLVGNTKINE